MDDEPDPLNVQCPNCFSKPGRDCTQPTDNGRREVDWFHLARINLAEQEAAK